MKAETIHKANELIKQITKMQDATNLFSDKVPSFSDRGDNEKIEAHIINLHRELEMLHDRLLVAGRKEYKYAK